MEFFPTYTSCWGKLYPLLPSLLHHQLDKWGCRWDWGTGVSRLYSLPPCYKSNLGSLSLAVLCSVISPSHSSITALPAPGKSLILLFQPLGGHIESSALCGSGGTSYTVRGRSKMPQVPVAFSSPVLATEKLVACPLHLPICHLKKQ